MNQIRNMIFDLDGTLIDSRSGIEYSARSALNAVFPDRSYRDLHLHIGIPIRQIFSEILDDADSLLLDKLVGQFRTSYDSIGWKISQAYQGATTVLTCLTQSEIGCFVATNKPRHATRCILEHLNLQEFFRDVVAPDSRNPPFSSKREVVAHIMSEYCLNAEETMFVGDSQEDRSAADANGLPFCAATYGYGDPLSEPDGKCCYMIVSKLTDVTEVLGVSAEANRNILEVQ
jgi:phosphoglycolate phosphatase